MKEKVIGGIIAGLLICLMLGLVFGGLIDTTCATGEKTTISVTESSSQPDLIVKDIAVYPDPPYTGGGVRVFTYIKNQGNADVTGSFSVKFYFDGTYTGEYNEIDGLPAGASKNPIVGVILWPTDTNPHVVKCVIDPDNTISESNEDNNERSESFSAIYNQPPTLSTGYVDPPSGDTSTVFNYYVTYKDPDGDAPLVHFVSIESDQGHYSSYSGIMTKISGDYKTGAVFKYSTTLPALPAGEHYVYSFYFEDGRCHRARLPPSGMYDGPTVTAIVHDMAVTDVQTSPDSPTVGQSTTIYVTVKNKGNQQEKNVPVKAYVGDSQVGSTQVTLSAGKSITKSFTWTPSTAKTYSVKGEVGIVSGETDTSDNKKTKSVSVQQPNQPPTCAIELRRQGTTTTTINEIGIGEFFDIYVGDSTDDISIKEVRFSSDDSQEGNPTGTWTGWYDWDMSSEDWNAISKTKAWLFTIEGSKEVWAEVKDGDGQTRNGFANIVTENLYRLAKAIMSEASVGTQEERIAVGWTVLNRLDSNEFPSTIKQVVESGYAYNQEPTQDIIDLSKDILERKYSDPTGGATHFFSPISMPWEGDEEKFIERLGEHFNEFDTGGGLHEVSGIGKRVYFPSWTKTLTWVGDSDNVRRAYFMFYRSNQPPVADAGADRSVFSGELVYFDGSHSYGPDGTVVSYQWDFGDGETVEGCAVSHRFRGAMEQSKTYTVTLTAEDNSGATSADSISVTVSPLEKTVEVSHHPAIPIPGQTVFARIMVSYNWIHDDTYVVSRIHYESGGFMGVCAISIWDFHSHQVPLPIWSADIFSFGTEKEKNYYPRLEEVHYEGDIFEGISVDAFDVMNIYITGWAGISISESPSIPPPFFEANSACFEPDYTEAPDVPIEAPNFDLAHLCSPGELRVYILKEELLA